jgi:hypothetical protein
MLTIIAAVLIAGTLGFLLCAVLTGSKVSGLYDTITARDRTIDSQARTIGILRKTLNRAPSAEIVPLRRA